MTTRSYAPPARVFVAPSTTAARPAAPPAPVVARAPVAPQPAVSAPPIRRELVDPDLEPPPSFDINSPTPDHDMEPLDPSLESSGEAEVERVIVEGDEDSVTITAEDGEEIVSVVDDDGDVYVEVEDTSDVLLSAPGAARGDAP
jgi:hypothetical protein